jgi:hypothetical protein
VNLQKSLPATTKGVEHHIVTRGPSVTARFRRLEAEKLAAAKAEFLQLEKEGIVRRSDSPWASPLHMVRKPDGSWRPSGDYHRLNLVTEPDAYPLPNMMDFTTRVAGCKVFSKIDLRKGYLQIPMHLADIQKTAIIHHSVFLSSCGFPLGSVMRATHSNGRWTGLPATWTTPSPTWMT